MVVVVVVTVVAMLLGAVAGYIIRTLLYRNQHGRISDIGKAAEREAEAILKQARIDAKELLLKSRDEFEQSTERRRAEAQKLEERLAAREGNLDRKAELLDDRSAELDRREKELRRGHDALAERQKAVDEQASRQVAELERISGLTREEASKQILTQLAESLEAERAAVIRRFQEESRQRLEQDAQEIMVTAMQRYAGDCSYERTTSTIPLPNEEMKGRIIGREGRNIRAIEAATGVSVLIDDTPEAVVISCFDPVRREIARVAMERLVVDGRIHPTRIEEMVAKVRKEIEAEIQKAGQAVVDQLGITRLRQNLVILLGRLKYRYSYSQNVLMHSVEVASLMGMIAAQLGLDERRAKRAGLLHDIGKAVDHEVEGSHALIGADLLKRAGEEEDVVNAVGAHHGDIEKASLISILVELCDALSASRPGARSETTELYLKRLEQLEAIGRGFEGVEACYAIQAGRELRVVVEPARISEDKALILAREMADRIEKEMRYPGQIKVSLIRETRAVEYAK
jgi:ribonuclease Y